MYKQINLTNLSSEDVYSLIEEIPSDGSEISESENESDEMRTELPLDVNIDYLSTDEHDTVPINNVTWDSEDELPLTAFIDTKVKWTNNAQNATNIIPFEENVGPNLPDDLEYPVDYFLHLFPDTLLNILTFQTNLYATQKYCNNGYRPTTVEEIKCFLGINLLMGIKKLPSYRDFWSSRLELRDHFISSCMTRDRFGWLLTHLHLNDNIMQPKNGDPNYDKLYKVRPLLDQLSATFKNAYFPTREQSIDESMIRYKGRSSLRQYMPMKPIKRGYKIWVRSDSTGYVVEFQIYTGKVKDVTEKNLGARVIKDLTRELVGKHYHVYFDNFFNSVQLQRDLLKDGIYACGTARKDRKEVPEEFKANRKMKRGDSVCKISEDGIFALQWMDKKPILFLSNFHHPEYEETVHRKQKDGTLEEVKCKTLVKDYNRHMGYVDKSDMLKSCYELDRKSRKWWHRIFWHFVDLTVVNAFILFKAQKSGASLSLKDFKIAVSTGLIGANPTMPQMGRRSGEKPISKFKKQIPLERRTDKAAHMPEHGTKVRCGNCSTKAQPRRTRWHCTSCKVGLCLSDKNNCFIKFHEK